MEKLFMRAFERQHAAEAQMRQQAASYSRTLACDLLAAGHQPPPWLLPHPAAFAALFRRGAAEEQMQLQVEAYSQSIACALVDAGHLPPPWLLPHRAAGEGTFERSVPADARMRKQVVSYSLSLACALLAAGHRPLPWLLQSPADMATQGNTVRKTSVYLADPQSADHVQHELSEINHQVKQNTLEAPRFQAFEASNSMASPPLVNGSSHSTKSNFLEGLDCVSYPLPENGAIDIVGNVSIGVSQGYPQTEVSEETYSMPIVLPDKEAGHSSETPADVATQGNTIRKASIYLADPQSADHVQHELSEINCQVKQNTLGAPRFQAFKASNSMASPPLENGSSHSTKFNFLEGLDCVSCPVPKNGAIDIVNDVSTEASQGRSQTDVAEETFSMPIVLLDKEAGHSSETTYLDGPICLVGPKMENDLLQTIEQSGKLRKRSSLLDRCDNESSRTLEQQSSGCHVLSAPINESALQPFHLADTTEAHDVCVWNNIDITARPEALSAASSKGASVSHTLERNCKMLSGKNADHVQHVVCEINHLVKQNTLELVSSLEVPRPETFEGPSSRANPLLGNDLVDSAKPDFLEGHDIISRPLPEIDAIDTVGNVSIEVSQVWGQTDSREGTHSVLLLDNDTSYCVQTDFPEETYSVPSLLLDKEASHSSEARPFCLVSSKIEKDLLHTTEQKCKLRKRSRLLLDRCDNESSRTFEQQSSINESALQLYHLADTTEAHDVCVSNNIAICATPEALTAALSKRARVSHTLERNSVISSDKSVPMLEYQSFIIPVPSDSPTITERALQGFCESKKLVNFCSSLSVKYKIKPLGSVFQSLPSRFENLMNRSLSYSIDTNLSYASKYSLDYDDAFMMSNGQTSGSSNVYSVQDDSDVPLNLSFEKYDLRKLPAATESSSDYLGSISAFGCSKIDEDSTILGGNKNQAKPSHSIGRNYSRQCLSGRKPLGYATKIYQSKGTSSLELTAGKSYIRKPDQHVHIRVNQDIKNPKEVRALSIMNAGKITHSLHDRLRQTEMSCSKSGRNRREPHLEKGCRPQNTVSNLTSFIRLAKQNQQPPISCAKRDVRVRALKVAAAAKCREEKRQTEREMHKAAVKLALERSKQEKEHRQKQVEHRKKMGADFITRKRQREGDGKRENDRKKKCAKEALKHQKQMEEIIHSPNTVKEACPKDTDGKDLVENLVQRVGNQLLSDKRMESVQRHLTSESNSVKAMYADCKSADSGLQVQENLSDNVDKSYGMTPYEDSDAKDFEVLEHQREIRRRHKLVPSWAQEGNLDKILVSNLALDSREVFAHKCSAILSDVLARGNPHRPIY